MIRNNTWAAYTTTISGMHNSNERSNKRNEAMSMKAIYKQGEPTIRITCTGHPGRWQLERHAGGKGTNKSPAGAKVQTPHRDPWEIVTRATSQDVAMANMSTHHAGSATLPGSGRAT